MDTVTKNNAENRKHARVNAQRASSQRTSTIQEARSAASILLALLLTTITTLAKSLRDNFLHFQIELLSRKKTNHNCPRKTSAVCPIMTILNST
jgi:hypothetical protein